ncbi:MAG: nitroimidazol reductase NimA-like FMN-containing flavoprotein [Limisphaerales bacterium]|jgi:nitroimidazol reductase NimA-like FMN-containing flavoprotein (pyridoxamine 5'-phosphate oxidase superfamily)
MSQKELEVLKEMESRKLLLTQSVGRFVYSDSEGPAAIPVNFGVHDDDIIFRIGDTSLLRWVLADRVAFEVDDLHPESGTGWSVLLRGQAKEVPIGDVSHMINQMQRVPQPVVEGVHNVWVSFKPSSVTGRRLGDSVMA